MVVLEYEGVELDHCPLCLGCWLDEGELELILYGSLRPAAPPWIDLGGNKARKRCPRCGRRLREVPAPGATVMLDLCPAGDGLWLDRGELQTIIREASAPDRPLTPLARFCANVFSVIEANNHAQKKEEPTCHPP